MILKLLWGKKGLGGKFEQGWVELTKTVPSVADLREFLLREVITESRLREALAYHGYPDEWIQGYVELTKKLPSYAELREFLWRDIIDESKLKTTLAHLGYAEEWIDGFVELTKLIPPAPDLIRMVVKEAFVPEMITPAPRIFAEYMEKRGYAKEWSDRWWTAHWVLPPPTSIYTALHRGLITWDPVMKYLTWHDYRPEAYPGFPMADTELMAKLSWDIPGRIDLRWMWEWGVITTEQLEQWVVKSGIDPDYAKDVAQGWLGMLLREERMRVVRAYTEAFIKGWITEDELRKKMKEMMITKERIDLYIEAAKRELETEDKEDLAKGWLTAFRKELIDETKLRSALIDLGMQDWKIETLVKLELARKKLPS